MHSYTLKIQRGFRSQFLSILYRRKLWAVLATQGGRYD